MKKSTVFKFVFLFIAGALIHAHAGNPAADVAETGTKAVQKQSTVKDKSAAAKKTNFPVTKKVYITPGGKKYHKKNCTYLKKHKTLIDLKKARARGYLPCSRCKPPK